MSDNSISVQSSFKRNNFSKYPEA